MRKKLRILAGALSLPAHIYNVPFVLYIVLRLYVKKNIFLKIIIHKFMRFKQKMASAF